KMRLLQSTGYRAGHSIDDFKYINLHHIITADDGERIEQQTERISRASSNGSTLYPFRIKVLPDGAGCRHRKYSGCDIRPGRQSNSSGTGGVAASGSTGRYWLYGI